MRAIAEAITDQARHTLAKAQHANAARAVGTKGLTIDFHSARDRERPVNDAKWTVRRVRWNGDKWQRYGSKIGGAMSFTGALDRLSEECERHALPRVE